MDTLLYYIIYFFCYSISLLPFRALYILSDIIYFPLYYVIRYRRRVVRKNLIESFPDKSLNEIVHIEKKFYSFFCDYFFETLKLLSVSKETLRKRMRFEGIEGPGGVNEAFNQGRSAGAYLGHYCNWEWVSSLPLHVNEGDLCGQIYHKLSSKAADRLFLKLRSRMGAVNIPMKSTLRQLVTYHKNNQRFIIGFISDQSPRWNNIHHWMSFLNHPQTPVFTGTERLAKQLDLVVFYADVSCVKRGHYVCTFRKITDTPKSFPDYDITEIYMRELEKTIRKEPQYWLWTHKRWKWTRERFDRDFEITPDGRVKQKSTIEKDSNENSDHSSSSGE